jgi:hypothetical protein
MLDTELDLSFRAAGAQAPSTLTQAQVEFYNREGYVRPFDVFGSSEIAGIRKYIDGLMSAAGPDGAYGINCYQARLAGIWDIATAPGILDHVQDILGPDIICWASAILSKTPHDPKEVPWHQDACFWKLSPARTVTVWLAIDDADEENSAMRFLPRSHDIGKIEESEMGAGSVFHKGIRPTADMGEPVTNTLKAGQMSMHADMLVHGSLANRSDRRRCGLTLRYCPPEVRIVDADWAQGVEAIICRGSDPSGHWSHHARPDNNDITKTSSPHVIGNN